MQTGPKPTNKFFSRLGRIEELVLSVLLLTMILLACVQIALRIFFSSGLTWADPFLRYLVIWTGLLGAAMATSKGKHISMDIVSFLAPPALKPWLLVLTNMFCFVVAGFLTWAAILFLKSEIRYGHMVLLGMASWIWNLIFPIAFALIALRFFIAALKAAMAISAAGTNEKSGLTG